jgi:hypothetical protein
MFTVIREYLLGHGALPTLTPTPPRWSTDEEKVFNEILGIIRNPGQLPTLSFNFRGYSIPISYFYSWIRIKGLSVQNISIEQVYQSFLEYIQIAKDIQLSGTDVTLQQAVTIQFILNVLKSGGDLGDVVFQGVVIPKSFIYQILQVQNLSIGGITWTKLYYIIYLYLLNNGLISSQNIKVPQSENAGLLQIILKLVLSGLGAVGSIVTGAGTTTIQLVSKVLQILGLGVNVLDTKYLWLITQLLTAQ